MLDKMYFYAFLKICNVLLKGTRFFKLKRKILNKIGISIGEGTKIVGPINIGSAAKLKIGNNCWVGTNLTIHGNGMVVIGNNNDLAPDITILTGSHKIGTCNRRAGKGLNFNYSIGNGNWIGARTTILNSAKIGNGVVIGACSVVTKDCTDNFVYYGCPAKKARSLN